jgi:hypothetical protein
MPVQLLNYVQAPVPTKQSKARWHLKLVDLADLSTEVRLDWLRVVADLTRPGAYFPLVHHSQTLQYVASGLLQAMVSGRSSHTSHTSDVLAKISSDGTGLPVLCVHVPTAISVPAEPAALAEAAASAAQPWNLGICCMCPANHVSQTSG